MSGDKTFSATGSESKIEYQADFLGRKKVLEMAAAQDSVESRALVDFWVRELYAGVPGLRDVEVESGSGMHDSAHSNHAEEVEAIQLLGGNGGRSGASPDNSFDRDFTDEDPFPISTSLSTTSTQPASPRPTPEGALARNERLLYQDESTISWRYPLSRESTIRAFAPALSPSALTVMTASTPAIFSSQEIDSENQRDDPVADLGPGADGSDVAVGIVEAMAIIDLTTSESSASARGRAVRGRGRKAPGPAAADSRPTRSGTRTRKTTVRS